MLTLKISTMQGSFCSSSLIKVNKLQHKPNNLCQMILRKGKEVGAGGHQTRNYLEFLNLNTGAHCNEQLEIVDISLELWSPLRMHTINSRTLSTTSS